MAELQLNRGVVLVDDVDLERVQQHTWTVHRKHGNRYAVTHLRRPDGARYQVRMHRFILGVADGLYVDHINHNGLDNRRANLRVVDIVTSNRNRRCLSTKQTSQFKGVSWTTHAKKWKACIRCAGRKSTTIALFKNEEEAAVAYDLFAVRFWNEGDYVLNFPDKLTMYKQSVRGVASISEMRALARKGG